MMEAVCAAVFFGVASLAHATDPDALKQAIDEKSKALSAINAQIQETQKNLSSTTAQSHSLNQEIKNYDGQINHLNLVIKASEIKIDKLKLEMSSLGDDISAKEQALVTKKGAVTQFLRVLQSKDQETTLVVFLKSQSLAESVSEAQSLSNLNNQLSNEISDLQILREDLNNQLTEASQKKTEAESEGQALKNRKTISEQAKEDRAVLLKSTKNQEKLYQTQLQALEKQQEEIATEVEGYERELRSKIDPNGLPQAVAGVLKWPAASALMSQGYGYTSFASRTYKNQYHNGVDIAGPIGTDIYAAEDGIVVLTGNQDLYCPHAAYGKFIVIRHYNGLTTIYGHLSQILTSVGAQIKRGDLIGYMGKTGWATGPHVHFTVWSTPTYTVRSTRSCGPMPVGGDLNPLNYLGQPTAGV